MARLANAPRTAPLVPRRSSADRQLVCAPAGPARPASVVLADGSFETLSERVFWLGTPGNEVLRLPLDTPVVVRPVHVPSRGERALAAAVAHQRTRRRTVPV